MTTVNLHFKNYLILFFGFFVLVHKHIFRTKITGQSTKLMVKRKNNRAETHLANKDSTAEWSLVESLM